MKREKREALRKLGIKFEIRTKKLPKRLRYGLERIEKLLKYLEGEFEMVHGDIDVPKREDGVTRNYDEPKVRYMLKGKHRSSKMSAELSILSTIYAGRDKYKSSVKLIISIPEPGESEAEKLKELGFQDECLLIKHYEFEDSKKEKYDIEKLANEVIKTYRKVIKICKN